MRQKLTSPKVDVVWDTYLHNSLKPGENEVRAYRERWQTRPRSQAIGLTSAVTRQRSRKVRKSEKIVSTAFPAGKHVFAASGATVVRTGSDHCMPLCDHEEVHVDTIIVVHPPARCSREWMYHMPGAHCECWCCRHPHWQVHFLGDYV